MERCGAVRRVELERAVGWSFKVHVANIFYVLSKSWVNQRSSSLILYLPIPVTAVLLKILVAIHRRSTFGPRYLCKFSSVLDGHRPLKFHEIQPISYFFNAFSSGLGTCRISRRYRTCDSVANLSRVTCTANPVRRTRYNSNVPPKIFTYYFCVRRE